MNSKVELMVQLCAREIGEVMHQNLETAMVELDLNEIANTKAIQILSEIKSAMEEYDLEQQNDFETVENLVGIFEKYGISAGCCHDF